MNLNWFGVSPDLRVTIIRGNTTIEDNKENKVDPLFNLGDRIISGAIEKDATSAFVYRSLSSSIETPFRLPYSYNKIWESTGQKVKKNVRIWSLNCPPDYVAIGYIATMSPDYPKQGDIYCVRRYFVELGNLNTDKTGQENIWKEVWNSLKTRANLKGRARTSFFRDSLLFANDSKKK